jgi:hypothetical protein
LPLLSASPVRRGRGGKHSIGSPSRKPPSHLQSKRLLTQIPTIWGTPVGRGAKVRFTISVNGIDREIFSVRDDAKDGSINIFLRETPFWHEPGAARSWKSVERRYSVHPSSQSQGTTIKYSSVAQDALFEYSSFVNDTNHELLWMLWASRQWAFEDDNHLKEKMKDKIVCLGSLDETHNTLIYTVWVWDVNRPMYAVQFPLFYAGARFRNFQIAVYFTVIPVPAANSGISLHISTSKPRVDKGPTAHTHTNTKSYEVSEIVPVTLDMIEIIRSNYMKFLKPDFPNQDSYNHFVERSFMLGKIFGVDNNPEAGD